MSKNKEWASHIELVALADILGVPILVTTNSNDEDQYQVWVYPNNVKTEEVMLLGYSDISCHYYSLEATANLRAHQQPSHCMDKKQGKPGPVNKITSAVQQDGVVDQGTLIELPDIGEELDICIKPSIKEEVILSLGSMHVYGKGIMDITKYSDLDQQTLSFLLNLSLIKFRRGIVARLTPPYIKVNSSSIGSANGDCQSYAAEIRNSSDDDIIAFTVRTALQWQLLLAYKSDLRVAVFSPIIGDPQANTVVSKLSCLLNQEQGQSDKPVWRECHLSLIGTDGDAFGYKDSGVLVYKYFECIVRRRLPAIKVSAVSLRKQITRLLLTCHDLPEIKATSKLDSILCNGDLSEPESDSEEFFESGTQVREKSLFKLTPDFKKIADVDADNSDEILFKFGSIKSDWEKDALRLAWQKSDLRDDKDSPFKRDWIRSTIKDAESKWISLLQIECDNTQTSYYYKKFLNAKSVKTKIRDYNIRKWPLNIYVPDMVEEVIHYMTGLASTSCKRGVIWKINMAYDVLYNEAMVYLLMVKYDVDYATAIDYHLKEVLPDPTT